MDAFVVIFLCVKEGCIVICQCVRPEATTQSKCKNLFPACVHIIPADCFVVFLPPLQFSDGPFDSLN